MKKLTVSMAVLIFSLIFAAQTNAAGVLGVNNGMGTSSTTSTDHTGSGSKIGGGTLGTGVVQEKVVVYPTSTPTPPSTYGSYGSYNGSTGHTLSTPTRYGGTSSTSYNTNGTMRGYNYTAKATTTNNNNWGWMGLLGLLGLIGLRNNNDNRDREREREGKH
jgi:hypothetical protein